ncbi:MAG: twin-arginine translocase TatA/TatE family subunit [Acidimicrobiaceae bacterium]|nr:twin-arginine translocase TatA/TatE family subunit [Acidimicrobiaceae bacterium]
MILGEIFGGMDPIIVIVVIVLLFGAKKLPQLARSLGSASSEFKKGLDEGSKDEPNPQVTQMPTQSIPNNNQIPTAQPIAQQDLEPPKQA